MNLAQDEYTRVHVRVFVTVQATFPSQLHYRHGHHLWTTLTDTRTVLTRQRQHECNQTYHYKPTTVACFPSCSSHPQQRPYVHVTQHKPSTNAPIFTTSTQFYQSRRQQRDQHAGKTTKTQTLCKNSAKLKLKVKKTIATNECIQRNSLFILKYNNYTNNYHHQHHHHPHHQKFNYISE